MQGDNLNWNLKLSIGRHALVIGPVYVHIEVVLFKMWKRVYYSIDNIHVYYSLLL